MLSKQHSNETNGTLNATVSLKRSDIQTVIKIPSISVAEVAIFPCKSHHGLLETKTSGPWKILAFLEQKSMARIKNPNGSSIQKENLLSGSSRRSPSCPTSKVGFNAASFGRESPGCKVQRQRSGSSPVPKLVEVGVMKKNNNKKNKTLLPETNMFPL